MTQSQISMACRMLWLEGHEHFALGHVSERIDASRYRLKASGRGLGETRPEDVVTVDEAGVTDDPSRLHSEAPIHTEILRARPDVQSVVHTHHPAVAALSASDADFEMVSQDSVYFAERLAFFDSAAMITDAAAGQALAGSLALNRAVIMRNHGLVTVGASVEEAVFLAVCLARSVSTQERAGRFGTLVAMTPADVAALSAEFEANYAKRVSGQWRYLERMLALASTT